jgi:hypothetical protein
MKIVQKSRQCGKTTDAIYESNRTGKVIVVFKRHSVEIVKRMAKKLNISIPEPITYWDLTHKSDKTKKDVSYTGLIFDDFDLYLREMTSGLPIETIYMTVNSKDNYVIELAGFKTVK